MNQMNANPQQSHLAQIPSQLKEIIELRLSMEGTLNKLQCSQQTDMATNLLQAVNEYIDSATLSVKLGSQTWSKAVDLSRQLLNRTKHNEDEEHKDIQEIMFRMEAIMASEGLKITDLASQGGLNSPSNNVLPFSHKVAILTKQQLDLLHNIQTDEISMWRILYTSQTKLNHTLLEALTETKEQLKAAQIQRQSSQFSGYQRPQSEESLRMLISEYQTMLITLKQQKQSLQSQIQTLNTQIKTHIKSMKGMHNEVTDKNKLIQKLQIKCENHNYQFKQIESDLIQSQKKCNTLQESLKSMQDQLQSLTVTQRKCSQEADQIKRISIKASESESNKQQQSGNGQIFPSKAVSDGQLIISELFRLFELQLSRVHLNYGQTIALIESQVQAENQ